MTAGIMACVPRALPVRMGDASWGVKVTWHGHSCFSIEDNLGRVAVIDPFDETVGYGRLRLVGDVLMVTHDHFDHNYRHGVISKRRKIDLVESTGTVNVAGGMYVTGISSFHDKEKGQIHGSNLIFAFTMGGLRLVHLGDLSPSDLTRSQIAMMGRPDILFVPVGGVTSLNFKEAKKVVNQLKPRAVFPMHYGDVRAYRFDPVSEFLSLFEKDQIHQVGQSSIQLKGEDLQESLQVFILSPTKNN